MRSGQMTYLHATYEPAGTGGAGTVTAVISDSAELGQYDVKAVLDDKKISAGQLSIQPPGNPAVVLTDLSPSAIYRTETVYVPDPADRTSASIHVSDAEVKADRTDLPAITVRWRDAEYRPILNGCSSPSSLGAENEPVEAPSHFYVKGAGNDALIFCNLPTDAQLAKDGTALEAKPVGDTHEMWIRKPTKAIARRVFRVTLHGKGFQVTYPSDNAIWINDTRQNVEWDTCSGDTSSGGAKSGDPQNPVPLRIHGEVVTAEEMQLCSVPIPAGDQLRLAVGYGDTKSNEKPFHIYRMGKASVAIWSVLISALLALLPLFLLSFVQESYRIAGSSYKFRMLFLDPETDTYSLSKLQFYLWTVVSLFAYSYLVISRIHVQFAPWPDVPSTLPGIIAVAAGTAVGSQLITSAKGSKGAGEEAPSFADFITSGGVVAADRLQMLLWTLLGVGVFIYAVLHLSPGTITDLPPVPDRLLVLMGLSSAGYLGGKIARKAGPVIDEISVSPPDPDDVLASAAASRAVNLPDLIQPIADAQRRLGLAGQVSDSNAQAAKDALAAAISKVNAAHTMSDYDQLAADLDELSHTAEAAAEKAAEAFSANKSSQADAEAAQSAAAALQDLLADTTQAITVAAADPMMAELDPTAAPRTIEVRGSNLSAEAILELDHVDMPFRMLVNSEGRNAPEIVLRDVSTPTFARVLRLTIDPSRLMTVDRVQFKRWFGSKGHHVLTLTNPDGQKAEMSFDLPPGATQKVSNAA
ncbi:MAG TPA: hypothetical protein VF126_12380 [Acidobacteriaceae bacterium]